MPMSNNDAPLAAAERLARYERDTFNADCTSITTTLTQWRDRERLTLTDALLGLIAAHVAHEAGEVVA